MLLRSTLYLFSFCLILTNLVFLLLYEIVSNKQFSVKYGQNGNKYILYWNSMWHFQDFQLGFGSKIFENCPVNNCFTTKNRTLIPITEFDALVFHGVEYRENDKNNPPERHIDQVYIYFNLETTYNTGDLNFSKGFFNWTMSYR